MSDAQYSWRSGPKELADALLGTGPSPIESGFLAGAWADGLVSALVDAAYQASIQPDEGRYARISILLPPPRFSPEMTAVFEPPVPLDARSLKEIAPAVAVRPFGLVVDPDHPSLRATGVARLEFLSGTRSALQPGLLLTINGPASLSCTVTTPHDDVQAMRLDRGELSLSTDVFDAAWTSEIARRARRILAPKIEEGSVQAAECDRSLRTSLATLLSGVAEAHHGGAVLVLPPTGGQTGLETEEELRPSTPRLLARPRIGCSAPAIGHATMAWAAARNFSPAEARLRGEDARAELVDALSIAKRLPLIDGCMVLDAALRVRTSGSIIRAEGQPDPRRVDPIHPDRVLAAWDMTRRGTRHQTAAAMCHRLPGAYMFVASQDGGITAFKGLPPDRVHVCGPLDSVLGAARVSP